MLTVDETGDVAVLRVEHGRVNALDTDMLRALTAAVAGSDQALVLTGSGSAFSAGVDLRRILDGGPDLADHLVGTDQRLPAHVPALLRHDLVLELDAGDAGLLVELHGPDDVDRVAVSGVGVGDHRHVDGGHDPAGVVDHLRAREQSHVGAADQRRRRPEAGHVDDVEAGLLDEPGRQGVVGAGSHDRGAGRQQLAQARSRSATGGQQVRHRGLLVVCSCAEFTP